MTFGRVINQLDDNLTSMTPSEELVNLAATALGREAVVEGPAKTRNVKILRNKLSDIRSTMRALRQMNGVFGAQRDLRRRWSLCNKATSETSKNRRREYSCNGHRSLG